MEQPKQTQVNTGMLINIGLIIGGLLIGRKVLQSIGILKTAEEQKNIEQTGAIVTGSELTPTKTDPTNPALAFNPKYNNVIIAEYNKKNNITTAAGFIATREKFMPVDKTQPKSWGSQLYAIRTEILNSKGLFNDDEERIYAAFNKLRNQAQVSYIAELFQKDKRDLSTFLKSFLNTEEMAKLYRIVANKPLLM